MVICRTKVGVVNSLEVLLEKIFSFFIIHCNANSTQNFLNIGTTNENDKKYLLISAITGQHRLLQLRNKFSKNAKFRIYLFVLWMYWFVNRGHY